MLGRVAAVVDVVNASLDGGLRVRHKQAARLDEVGGWVGDRS